jgi:hypothetical protein
MCVHLSGRVQDPYSQGERSYPIPPFHFPANSALLEKYEKLGHTVSICFWSAGAKCSLTSRIIGDRAGFKEFPIQRPVNLKMHISV